ncbi:M20/M25/M40 family metallo-hydrolase [Dactylosporangium sp. AC04546]|uniref:M20 metallopeptidase family protein n=1 Tax=Dactylosporangium sp. AC04546 TaxID=2862460 RepID=UPI001EDE3D13|nr:M20/M25/M40 family metallo-hydrolase [Dactylosporangium sp. AC04546]WVK78685.1 M20/M25/M40 family metallo-hydrolase [Dactylosporangium sp. AC04546]
MGITADRVVSRRAVLAGAAAGAAVAGLGQARAAGAHSEPGLVALRRDIHRHPELAGAERRTAGIVARRLRAAGLAVTEGVGGHGVVGVLAGAHRGRTVAYRADMDAVPPDEQFGGEATQPAHVCGHDLHTTIGVGVAEALARRRRRLAGTVVFVFQPAEESLGGAAAMLADDVFARARPAEIHALHCGPFPVGQFHVMPGYGLPGQDRGTVTLTGPDAQARAVLLARRIAALGTVTTPETTEALERLVADLQVPGGPLAEFVFIGARPAGAEVRFTYRCWPEQRYVSVRADIERLARESGPATVTVPPAPFPAMICPEPEGEMLQRYLRRALGPAAVGRLHAAVPFSGEDFALFLRRMPGTYTFLGVRRPGAAIESAYPHFTTFDPDERAIGHGVRAMTGWLLTRTGSGR